MKDDAADPETTTNPSANYETWNFSPCFDLSVRKKVAHLKLCRPEAYNSMTPEFWDDLPAIVNGLSDSGEIRAMVISSAGKHFSSGMDLSVFSSGLDGSVSGSPIETARKNANLMSNVLYLQDTFNSLQNARFPVLVAIQGGCIGGAVDMVTAADMRYATKDAWFCIQETNIGMTADVGTLQRLPKIIPDGVARQIAFTGERMSADRALQYGLVNEVYPDQETMLKAVTEIAETIAEKSPMAIWGIKESINYSRDHTVTDSMRFIANWQSGMLKNTDLAEAFRAHSQKETPNFQDLGPIKRGLS